MKLESYENKNPEMYSGHFNEWSRMENTKYGFCKNNTMKTDASKEKSYQELRPGDICILDKGFVNAITVVVLLQTPMRRYTTVKINDSLMDVMTYRLSYEG